MPADLAQGTEPTILRILGTPRLCLMPHTEAWGPGVFLLIMEKLEPGWESLCDLSC